MESFKRLKKGDKLSFYNPVGEKSGIIEFTHFAISGSLMGIVLEANNFENKKVGDKWLSSSPEYYTLIPKTDIYEIF